MFMLVLHSIELPHTIPKSSFERDLDFYGLAPEEGEIKNNSMTDVVESLRNDLDRAKKKHDMFLLASEAHHQFLFKKESSKTAAKVSVDNVRANLDLGISHSGKLSQAEKDLFLNYLDVYYGLRMATASECGASPSSKYGCPHLYPGKCFYVIRK